MECKLLFCAQATIVDFQSKRISAIQIYEDFNAPIFPVAIQTSICTFIQRTIGEPNSPDIFLQIKLEESVLVSFKLNVTFVGNSLATKNVADIGALVIPSPGKLSFLLTYNNNGAENIIGTYSFDANSASKSVENQTIPPATVSE